MNPNAAVFAKLRTETAALLKYDLSNLSAWESAKLDVCCLLRWELDRQQSAMLQGQPVDARQVGIISEQLETLLRPVATVATAHDYGVARAKLKALIDNAVKAADLETAFDAEREEAQAVLAALPPAALAAALHEQTNDEQTNSVSRVTFIDHATIQPQRPAPVPYGSEPWRDFIDDAGNIITRPRNRAPGS
jgi:hypothetical protein